ncbi:unnamed protein product, partial [Vitis vinifera]
MSLTANIICRIAFGKSFQVSEFGDGRFQEVVHEAVALLGGFTAADFFPYVGRIVDRLTGLHGRLERSFLEMDGFYERVIEDHLNPGRVKEEHEDIIDVLLKIERERSESGAVQFTKDSAKAIIMDLFLAGVDTGAITLTWAMTELARNPRIMKKAQVEVRSSIGKKGKVTKGDVDQLHYLKMVVKETLRLHPPVPLLVPRETMEADISMEEAAGLAVRKKFALNLVPILHHLKKLKFFMNNSALLHHFLYAKRDFCSLVDGEVAFWTCCLERFLEEKEKSGVEGRIRLECGFAEGRQLVGLLACPFATLLPLSKLSPYYFSFSKTQTIMNKKKESCWIFLLPRFST